MRITYNNDTGNILQVNASDVLVIGRAFRPAHMRGGIDYERFYDRVARIVRSGAKRRRIRMLYESEAISMNDTPSPMEKDMQRMPGTKYHPELTTSQSTKSLNIISN